MSEVYKALSRTDITFASNLASLTALMVSSGSTSPIDIFFRTFLQKQEIVVVKIIKRFLTLLDTFKLMQKHAFPLHCVKSVRIRSYSGPNFPRIFPHLE